MSSALLTGPAAVEDVGAFSASTTGPNITTTAWKTHIPLFARMTTWITSAVPRRTDFPFRSSASSVFAHGVVVVVVFRALTSRLAASERQEGSKLELRRSWRYLSRTTGTPQTTWAFERSGSLSLGVIYCAICRENNMEPVMGRIPVSVSSWRAISRASTTTA